MEKIKTFFKNYKKILLGALICLLCVLSVACISLFLSEKSSLTDSNNRKLKSIAEKADTVDTALLTVTEALQARPAMQAKVAAGLLSLVPSDLHDPDLLSDYAGFFYGIDHILVLDKNRFVINSSGSMRDTDYADPYYDPLFAGEEGQCLFLAGKEDGYESCCIKSGDFYLVFQPSTDVLSSVTLTEADLWELSYDFVGLNSLSHFAAVSTKTGLVLYSDCPGLPAGSSFPADSITDGFSPANSCYVNSLEVPDRDAVLLAVTRSEDAFAGIQYTLFLIFALFTVALILLIAFVIFLREGELDPSQEFRALGKYFLHSQTASFRFFSLITALIFVILYSVLSCIHLNQTNQDYISKESASCAEALDVYAQKIKSSDSVREDTLFGRANACNAFLSRHEEYISKEGMGKLADVLDIKYLTVFDENGKTVATSSPLDHLDLLAEPDSSFYDLRYVLTGKEALTLNSDPSVAGEGEILYAVPKRDGSGYASGIIAFTTDGGNSNEANTFFSDFGLEFISREISGQTTVCFVVDSDGFVITPMKEDFTVSSTEELGISSEELSGSINGTYTIDGKKYLISADTVPTSGTLVFIMLAIEWFTSKTLTYCIGIFVLFLLMCLWIAYDGLGSKYHFEKRALKVKDADDWERTEPVWEELSVSRKMSFVIDFMINGFSLYLLILAVLYAKGVPFDSAFNFIFSRDFQRSFNLYATVNNLCVICISYSLVRLAGVLISSIESAFSTVDATAGRLLLSFIKYLTGAICLCLIASNYGADTLTVLASLGLAGFAISCGAQDLIKDMIAGMFLLFEKNFKVGDMLLYENNWYWVKSLGVRSTRLEAWGQVRIINNSKMTGVINIQNSSACVNCDVMIGNEYDIDEVEEIICAELPRLKETYPPEVSTPTFKGVQQLTGYGTQIRVRAYCPPLDQGWVGRSLRREMKRILDTHGIRIAEEGFIVTSKATKPEELEKENLQ